LNIQLFEHNQTAYNSAVSILTEQGKAAIVHPTGTGKSFIGFKLCEDNPNKTICWLSPSRYIYQTQIENLKEVSNGYEPENVKFYTYAKLMLLSDEELEDIQPDYIILDEFHRCGAEYWGNGVQKLLYMYADTPILGLSATAIRYLDNQRNMTEELFDGNIASEMTLGEAIVRGILQPPKYVLSIFSYQKDLEKYEKRVANTNNIRIRDTATAYLEALRRALDKADKLDVLFEKHMTEKTGKYIVFCANRDHMQDMIELADEWFAKVDSEFHIYKAYSNDPETSKAFADFKADTSNHLKLLYCIDMLNEGVHVDDISGVILLRPTVSPIIFKQQIGRALSASKHSSPVIFDIVNNIENLYSIDSVKEEMEIAVRYFREYDRDSDIVNDTFEVNDDIRDCIELFNSLEDTLTVSWETMFAEAKRYYEQYGNLIVPTSFITENGNRLGQWLVTQRKNYNNGKKALSESRIQRLESIGMCWLVADERYWNEAYEICRQHYEKYHSLEDKSELSPKIKHWILRQRAKYNSGELDADKIEKLTAIGMIWNLDEIWDRNYEHARKYYEEHGNLDIQAAYVTEDGFSLGRWYRTIRKAYLEGRLDDDRKKRLVAIGFEKESVLTRSWMQKYILVKKYYEDNGNLNIKTTYIAEDGTKLGVWISTQREKYNKQLLDKEQIELLEKIGMVWNKDDSRWNVGYEHAKKYAESVGDINSVSEKYLIDDFKLCVWMRTQRERYRKGKLSPDRVKKLEAIGVIWNVFGNSWEQSYLYARDYFIDEGNLNVPHSYICKDGFRLGQWISSIRNRYRNQKLTSEQIQQMESIGMIWNVLESKKELELKYAKTYFTEFGNLDIPNDYICADGYRLGAWLRIIRMSYRNGSLSDDYIHELERMGIIWNPKQKSWENGCYHLKMYYQEYGNGNVPLSYICEDGYKLGQWLRGQRRANLTDERKTVLNSMGVDL